MSLINKHTKEDFFYVPSTVTNTTHPRHKLAQASKFHLLVTFLNFLKLIHVLIPLPPCWLHLKHFYACLPFTFNFFYKRQKARLHNHNFAKELLGHPRLWSILVFCFLIQNVIQLICDVLRNTSTTIDKAVLT